MNDLVGIIRNAGEITEALSRLDALRARFANVVMGAGGQVLQTRPPGGLPSRRRRAVDSGSRWLVISLSSHRLATPAQVAKYLHTTEAALAQMRYMGNGPKFIKVNTGISTPLDACANSGQ